MKKTLLLFFYIFFFIFYLNIFTQPFTWTKIKPNKNDYNKWFTTSISSDGMKMIAGAQEGRLYLSSDAGITWKETQPRGDINMIWYTSAMDSDASIIIAGAAGVGSGRLFLSTNFGNSWSEIQPAGNTAMNWCSTAISGNGSKIFAGVGDGRLYVSSDTGKTWNETQPAGNVDMVWRTISLSLDGSKIIAGAETGRLYISNDGGYQWNEVKPVGNIDLNWMRTAMSSNGSRIIAGVLDGRLYISTNSGESWRETQPAVDNDIHWSTTTMSADGLKIIAGYLPGKLYFSTNGGNNWEETQPDGNVNAMWESVSMNSDGTGIIAGSLDGRIFVVRPKITFPIITITSPSGGENLPIGSSQKITWVSYKVSNLKLEYTTDNGTNWINIVSSIPADSGYYSWIVPNTPSSKCKIKITNLDDTTLYSVTNDFFTILAPNISITSPDSGAIWQTGTAHNITWSNYYVENVSLQFTTDNGINWLTIGSGIPASNESYLWTVPNILSSQCRIKIYSSNDTTISTISNIFSISDEIPVQFPLKVGNRWDYVEGHLDPTEPIKEYITTYKVIADTLMPNGKLYYMVRPVDNIFMNYIRAGSKGIYYYDVNCEKEWLYYNFELSPGEYSVIPINNRCDSIGFSTISKGGPYKRTYFGKDVMVTGFTYNGGFDITNSVEITSEFGFLRSSTPSFDGEYYSILAGCQLSGVVYGKLTSVNEEIASIPKQYSLYQNYPNPFNPVTSIKYQLPKDGNVTLKIYDILGREVAVLVNEFKQAGYYKAEFNASSLSSGVYIYRLTSDKFVATKKLILIK